jgi:diguanylate cyclase
MANLLFVISFLKVRKNIPWMYRFFQVAFLLCLSALLVSPFFDDGWTIRVGVMLVIPVSFVCVLGGIIVWRQGHRDTRFFSIAWSAFLVGVVLLALNKLGLIPRTTLTEHGAEWGTVVNLAMLAFAFAGRIKLERTRRQRVEEHARELERAALIAKEHALELEKMNSEQLERSVRARTRDLHKALSELSLVNRKLEQLNRVDAVTGVGNENSFLSNLSQEWDRSFREGEVLSLIVVELDHYREILADFGHVAADECLRSVAAILEHLIARPADCITRYGDKVFGIILPATDEKGADYLAARVVKEVAAQPCEFGSGKVQLSVSVGVAAMLPRKAGLSKDILMSAESAVYVAKNGGGNRVEFAEVDA